MTLTSLLFLFSIYTQPLFTQRLGLSTVVVAILYTMFTQCNMHVPWKTCNGASETQTLALRSIARPHPFACSTRRGGPIAVAAKFARPISSRCADRMVAVTARSATCCRKPVGRSDNCASSTRAYAKAVSVKFLLLVTISCLLLHTVL